MADLIADVLRSDPRVAEAKRLLLEAIAVHQGRLAGVRPPDPDRKASYEEALRRFGELRGGPLFFPYLGSGFGKGPLVELADGSVKYDFISGIGVHYMGHCHPSLVSAAFDAAAEDVIMQGNLQQNTEAVAFSGALVDLANRSGAALEHVLLTTSGAMANENALKMAFQKRSPASRLLAFHGSFAGRTLALAQVTDNASYRVGLPDFLSVDRVPFFHPDDPKGSTERASRALERHLSEHPGEHAAMLFELVLGESGAYPGDPGFFRTLMELVRASGAAVLVDEIQTFGRTLRPFAFQHFALDDLVDVVTVGKLTQACATLFREEYRPKPGLVSQTFTGGTAALLAGKRILDELTRGGYFGPQGKIARLHGQFRRRLELMAARHPGLVRGPYGIGSMVAFTYRDGEEDGTKRFIRALFEAGVMSYTAGSKPSRVRFLVPAGVATEEDIEAVADLLESTLQSAGDL